MHSTETQCHALVLGTTGTTYIRQQQKYIGREKYEINKNKNKTGSAIQTHSIFDVNPFRAPNPLTILNPGNFVPKTGFQWQRG